MMTSYITSIQRFSVFDGPGIRTVVFLKGCPLHCAWCHNPECISFEPELMRYPQKCIHCGKCAEGCYSGAQVICGKEMTPEEVFGEVMQDKAYYGADGGLTVSGGEPLSHPNFVRQIVTLCLKNGIHTAIETSMYRFDRELLQSFSLIMTDIKIWDDELHRKYTGIGNRKIKENIILADQLGIPIIVRTPVISGINDSAEQIQNIAGFVRKLKNAVSYELLPYHPLGEAKLKALGREGGHFVIPGKDKMEELKQYADISR